MAEYGPDNPRYPDIEVQLTGTDGNVFALMGRVSHALKRGEVPHDQIDEMRAEVFSSDSYEAALNVLSSWVETY